VVAVSFSSGDGLVVSHPAPSFRQRAASGKGEQPTGRCVDLMAQWVTFPKVDGCDRGVGLPGDTLCLARAA
jgi:hypothetical protein